MFFSQFVNQMLTLVQEIRHLLRWWVVNHSSLFQMNRGVPPNTYFSKWFQSCTAWYFQWKCRRVVGCKSCEVVSDSFVKVYKWVLLVSGAPPHRF